MNVYKYVCNSTLHVSLPAETAIVNKTKFIVVFNRAQQLQQSRHTHDINRRFLLS